MRKLIAILAAFMVGLSVPAVASHVNEPTAPIEAVHLNLFKYPDGPGIDCDEDPVRTHLTEGNTIRIEAFVEVAGAPSEHWTTFLRVWSGPFDAEPEWPNPRTGARDNRLRWEWEAIWKHQNQPAHVTISPAHPGWRFIPQSDHYFNGTEGTFAVEVVAVGDASGIVVKDRCVFHRSNP